MANYKPSTKGVIGRDLIIPPRELPDFNTLVAAIALAGMAIFLYIIFFVFYSHILGPILYIVFFATLGIAAVLLLYHFINSRKKKKNAKPPVYYFELDKVTGIEIDEEMRAIARGRYAEYIKIYYHTIYFANHKSKKYDLTAQGGYGCFPTIKNGDNIISHRATIQKLSEGDECLLLMIEGEEKIIQVFDTKYYTLSPDDFRQDGDKYYLKG